MEADYIGLLLMAAAGYDPRLAPLFYEELGKIEKDHNKFTCGSFLGSHPPGRKRAEALARPEIMEEALILYNGARAQASAGPKIMEEALTNLSSLDHIQGQTQDHGAGQIQDPGEGQIQDHGERGANCFISLMQIILLLLLFIIYK
jgi:predicted Zn-dependent protease